MSLDTAFLDAQRAILEEKETQTLADIATIEAGAGDTVGIGFGKRVGDGTAIAVDRLNAVTTHDSLHATLRQVRHALALLESGEYGVCETCGTDIPEGRLEARPWATRCIAHS